MSAISKLQDLFNSNFAVDVDYNEANSRKVIDLFKVVRDLGVDYRIDEAFKDTWMTDEANDAYCINNWQYFGILNGNTFLSDCAWSDDKPLTVKEFEDIVVAAQGVTSVLSAKDTLGGDLVISGGVVVVNYKDGSSYHLEHDGKATLNVASRVVTTERTFLKDGQPAYERVIVKLESLESVQSDNLKLTVNEDGTKVDFTTTFTL
uniref:Uncharacterized protein n=1 Tax=Klebsiella phage FKP3 TaxID=3231233 RepID=A0AAU8HZY9_9CAUD